MWLTVTGLCDGAVAGARRLGVCSFAPPWRWPGTGSPNRDRGCSRPFWPSLDRGPAELLRKSLRPAPRPSGGLTLEVEQAQGCPMDVPQLHGRLRRPLAPIPARATRQRRDPASAYAEDLPRLGHTLQGLPASVVELESRPGGKIMHGA
jgi:hypothetical protein